MNAHILAELFFLLHFLFILFVIFGGLLALKYPRIAWLHLPIASWGALVNIMGWICPLTPLENKYRLLAHEAGYSTGFIEHYLNLFIYPPLQSDYLGLILGVMAVIWNVLIYGFVIYRVHIKKQN